MISIGFPPGNQVKKNNYDTTSVKRANTARWKTIKNAIAKTQEKKESVTAKVGNLLEGTSQACKSIKEVGPVLLPEQSGLFRSATHHQHTLGGASAEAVPLSQSSSDGKLRGDPWRGNPWSTSGPLRSPYELFQARVPAGMWCGLLENACEHAKATAQIPTKWLGAASTILEVGRFTRPRSTVRAAAMRMTTRTSRGCVPSVPTSRISRHSCRSGPAIHADEDHNEHP